VPRTAFGAAEPGESVERIVIRSNFNTHIAAVSERHVAPPKTSVEVAEAHGMLDTPAGPPDKSAVTYHILATKADGAFNHDPGHPENPVPHPEAQLRLPYLPDPFAPGAAFRSLPGTPDGSVWKTPFTGAWPNPLPFRLALDEGSGPPIFLETATERVLTIKLPKAEIVEVNLSCFLTDDATTLPPNMLSTMTIWSWIVEANPANVADLRALALDGGHWMLTPPRTLTLVHAVQQPLIEPQFQSLTSSKGLGATFATLQDEFPINGNSTINVDIEAAWSEPVDDLTDSPQPVIRKGTALPVEVKIGRGDTIAVVNGKHEFHDTKHRNVAYTAVATTRFREYFDASITADPNNITRRSLPETLSIANSARPNAPNPLYVLPTFGWTSRTEGAWNFSRRQGGGLRVYLDRPWFSSGEGELLGVVLWGSPPADSPECKSFEVPDSLKGYVTQWGMDPLWNAPPPPSQAVPQLDHFRNAVAFGEGLTLDELSNREACKCEAFSVAGHTVAYDATRKLWYCDIELVVGNAYFPFIRLALARYQPASVADAHLSRVVLAEFAQLLPDRSASISLDPIDLTKLQLAVNGLTYDGPGSASMWVTVQTQRVGGGDLAWVPVSTTAMTPSHFAGPDTLWTAQLTLPAKRGTRPFRLLIQEFETYSTDFEGPEQQTRLVYADYLNL